ncbi:MAG: VCBS repeat-containing protein [Rhodothermales bacterium]|nr:VCBS repeat-containing protein [Rhodothermales bacterium]
MPASAQFVSQVSPFPVTNPHGVPIDQPFFGGFDRPIPQLVDIDGDGDVDLFVQEDNDVLRFFENVGDARVPEFEWRTDDFQTLKGEWFLFVDLDEDLDLDLLVGINFNQLAFVDNIGTRTNPEFSATPLTIRDADGVVILSDPPMVPAILDVDCNDSLDLFLGKQDGTIRHFEQIGFGSSGPTFVLRSDRFQDIEVLPAGKGNQSDQHGANAQAFFDVDRDGDIDLYYGDFFEASVLLFRNEGTCSDINMERVSDTLVLATGGEFQTAGYNIPTPADLNGDDEVDLIVGTLSENVRSLAENLFYLSNDGGSFSLETSRLIDGLDLGTRSVPAFGDADGDGDADMVVGSSLSSSEGASLAVLTRTGDAQNPEFQLTDLDFLELDAGFNYSPTFADIDADGRIDLFVGLFNGRIVFMKGVETDPFFEVESLFFSNIDVGSDATPAFGDIDNDGDLDLLVGESAGTLNLFENTGSAEAPVFASEIANFDSVNVGQNSRPQLFDWDGDGDLDVILGGGFRGSMVAINTGSPTSLTLDVPALLDIGTGYMSSASFVDVDADGDMDLVSGDRSGGIRFFRNFDANTAINPDASPATDLIGSLYPNPTINRSFRVAPGPGIGAARDVSIELFDLLGRQVLRRELPVFDQAIEVLIPTRIANGPVFACIGQSGRTECRLVIID